jgi:hypothetical protein
MGDVVSQLWAQGVRPDVLAEMPHATRPINNQQSTILNDQSPRSKLDVRRFRRSMIAPNSTRSPTPGASFLVEEVVHGNLEAGQKA